MADIAQGSDVQEERLLAAIMRRVLAVEDGAWVVLAADNLCIDGWVRLDPDEEALVRRLTGEWET
jgi:hypothetical protein